MKADDDMMMDEPVEPSDHVSASKMMEEAPAPEAKAGPGKLTNVDISLTDNGGFLVRVSYRQPEQPTTGGSGASPSSYQEPKQYAFGNLDQLWSFLTETLGAGGTGKMGMGGGMRGRGGMM